MAALIAMTTISTRLWSVLRPSSAIASPFREQHSSDIQHSIRGVDAWYGPCTSYRVKDPVLPKPLTIGRLSALTGMKVETIRYYERIGLVAPPARTEGNYRSYAPADVARLEFIRRTRALGFPVAEVRALLALAADTGASRGEVDERASRQLTEVYRKIADLRALRRELSAVVDSCAGSTVGECRVLEAFSSGRVEGAGTTA